MDDPNTQIFVNQNQFNNFDKKNNSQSQINKPENIYYSQNGSYQNLSDKICKKSRKVFKPDKEFVFQNFVKINLDGQKIYDIPNIMQYVYSLINNKKELINFTIELLDENKVITFLYRNEIIFKYFFIK